MSQQQGIRILTSKESADIGIVELDMVGEKINKFNEAMLMRLSDVVQELKKSSYKVVIFTSKKNKIFVAGADIDEIKKLKTAEEFDKAVRVGQNLFNEIEDLPMPTIAAISGACAGGGCEFILACDYRIASDDKSTRIGLPETKLGIIPGFGGCVRLPRVIGLQAALDIILQGKLVDAKKAYKIGLIDNCVHQNILESFSLDFAKDVIKKGSKKRPKQFSPSGVVNKFLESFVGRSIVFSQAQKGVLSTTKGHYPAPIKAIEVIAKTYDGSNRQNSMDMERHAFCEVAVTDISKNLIHVFDLTEMVKRQTGISKEAESQGIKAKPVTHIGILGAGTMGGGVAYVAADKGIDSRMKDLNLEALGRGLKHARDLWSKEVKKKKITAYDLEQKMSLVTGTTDFSGFKKMDVVVEAIVEDMEIKKKVIRQTASEMRPDGIIVTNTSSLSVNEMESGHPNPQNFAGMHFFNPVHKMPLVEVIRGKSSSDETIATVFELAKKMGKMPVVVRDGPGFLVNRLLLPYLGEAAFLAEQGMKVETVDRAYTHDFGMPMGPFELMDEIGLDVCVKVLKIFKDSFGDRIEMSKVLKNLDSSGRQGRKNLKGFYLYDESGKRGEVDQTCYEAFGLKPPTDPLSTQECVERGIFSMVNECSLALYQDKIVDTPHEVDLAMIMGTGFPPFRGGLLKYADKAGIKYIVEQLKIYQSKGHARMKPTDLLVKLSESGKGFY
jgi:3-hydroxyacyl-CoA dehydrogenase/enoyl-CoA hydratase/3-hydroxybutyryl-CoA epimerase